ncbi:unnamed protein product [Diamesa tonsa]
MDLVELPIEAEADYFLALCDQQRYNIDQYFHIGGSYIGAGNNEFYWLTTEKRVNYDLKWGPMEPNGPGIEKCLSVYNYGGTYKFNDVSSDSKKWNFFCQHITNSNQYESKLVKTLLSTMSQYEPATTEWLPQSIIDSEILISEISITYVGAVDTSICKWYGNITRESGSYIKSLCYYDKDINFEEASYICHDHGMRLMRIEDNSVQTATFAYLSDKFLDYGIYHISGRNIDGSWYHDDNTSVNDNLQWKDYKRPESGCLALLAFNPFSIGAFPCSKNLHAVCEFIY